MSPCDIEDAPECDETVRPDRVAMAAAKAAALIPAAAGLGVARAWAGLRTLTPDDRFVIGHDPRRPGLFWLAGLGGHGISAGPAAGMVAADLAVSGKTERIDPALVSPERFIR
jgi:glycine/D-amino acid oxidase-like deaminating enzyme